MTIIEDWRPPIVDTVMTKQKLAEVDPDNIYPYRLPKVAATEDEITAAEYALGVTFDPEHRSFLGFANGWEYFTQTIMLFGTKELAAGPLRESAFLAFDHMPELLKSIEQTPTNLLPIAASLEQEDIFVMLIKEGVVGPQVLWLAEGEVIDTFETFGELFMSMLQYDKRRIQKIQGA